LGIGYLLFVVKQASIIESKIVITKNKEILIKLV